MSNKIASVGIYGDIHLCSKNYGAHRDYPKESLDYFKQITTLTRDNQLTHLIGLGDFTFGRFTTLEYRAAIDNELAEQFNLVNGNRFELKGNHDIASYGTTERDYYIMRGLLKPSCNLTIGNVNINMVDYDVNPVEFQPVIVNDENHTNIALVHNYYKFKDTQLPNFGNAIELDNLTNWFGMDYVICGHIHKIMGFKGSICKDGTAHECIVHYPGCMTRPAFVEDIDTEGNFVIIDIYDDKVEYKIVPVTLWSIDDAFNVEMKEEEKAKKEEKAKRVDISDVIKNLDAHDNSIGDPESIIAGIPGIDEKYKNKAIQLLKNQE